MGKEAAARFIALLAEDQDTRKQVAGSQLGALVEFAAQRGLHFSATELLEIADSLVRLQDGELTDAELEGVAGGLTPTRNLSSIEVSQTAASIRRLGSADAATVVTYGAGIPGIQSHE